MIFQWARQIKKIGSILQDDKIVKSGMVFNYYVKSHNFSDFRAGYYQLKPSMTLNQIAKELQKGGSSEPIQSQRGKVLIQEGATVENVADTISSQTDFSRSEFINLMKNQSYMKQTCGKVSEITEVNDGRQRRSLSFGRLLVSCNLYSQQEHVIKTTC